MIRPTFLTLKNITYIKKSFRKDLLNVIKTFQGINFPIRAIHDDNSSKKTIVTEETVHSSKTLVELINSSCIFNKDKQLFGTMNIASDGEKSFDWITYGQFHKLVENFKKVLVHHRIGHNDKIAIISNNRVEWAVAVYAANSLGAILVPMYEAQTEKDWTYIIKDSDSKMIIAATEKIYEKVRTYVNQLGKVESVLCLDAPGDLLSSYKRWMDIVDKEPSVPSANVTRDMISVIIYTSGTTGNPKGVELSHDNICSNLKGLKILWSGALSNNRSVAFLPWAHVYGQTAELHSFIAVGSAMGIVSNREYILESLDLVKPTMLLSVPALFNTLNLSISLSGGKETNQDSPSNGE